jgi:hypothetical protein
MSMHRALFWVAGAAAILALATLWGPMSRDRGTAGEAGGPTAASGSDTTALVLATTSTHGDLAECG